MSFNLLDWRVLVVIGCVALFILFLVILDLFLYRNKKKQSRLYMLVQFLPALIKEAEDTIGAGNGVSKLAFVLRRLEGLCSKLNIEYDESFFAENIEAVLSTPQVKNEDDHNIEAQ